MSGTWVWLDDLLPECAVGVFHRFTCAGHIPGNATQ